MRRVDLLIGDDIYSQIVAKTCAAAAAAAQVELGVWTVLRKSAGPSDPYLKKWRRLETSVLPGLLSPAPDALSDEERRQRVDAFFQDQGAGQAEHIEDVNTPAFVQSLVVRKPDFVVSVRCYQKFSAATIEALRLGGRASRLLNLHPGRLPDYRGVMTLLHQLAAEDLCGPATLHQVSPEWDDGAVLATTTARLSSNASLLSNYMRAGADAGAFLMAQVARANGMGLARFLANSQPQCPHSARYFSAKDAIAALHLDLVPLARLVELQSDVLAIFEQTLTLNMLANNDFAAREQTFDTPTPKNRIYNGRET